MMNYVRFEHTLESLLEIKENIENSTDVWSDMTKRQRESIRELVDLMAECSECFPDWLEMPEEEED